MYKLFEYSKIRKFFDILQRMDRSVSTIYINPNAKSLLSSDKPVYYCAREVFVNRTIKKWFGGKYVILYKNGYKKYLFVSQISYALTWGIDLWIGLINYANFGNTEEVLESLFSDNKYSFNDLYNLEGVWCENSEQHNKLLNLFKLELPVLIFRYKVYNTNLIKDGYKKKRKATDEDIYKHITEYIDIQAMTENEAWDKLKKETENKPNILVTKDYEIVQNKV